MWLHGYSSQIKLPYHNSPQQRSLITIKEHFISLSKGESVHSALVTKLFGRPTDFCLDVWSGHDHLYNCALIMMRMRNIRLGKGRYNYRQYC
jgi:hypothetical protein